MEPFLIFIGGLLGSSHCIGMCGGFALAVGSAAPTWRTNLGRQLVYSLGRIFSYSAAGAMVGYGGWRLVRSAPQLVHAQAWLCLVAGVLLVVQGLFSAGVLRHVVRRRRAAACLGAGAFSSFLRTPGYRSIFLAGLLNGLLPCGLVYAYLALATSTGQIFSGFGYMALFGLGTVPVMVATGCGGTLLGMAGRRRLLRTAAWCVVVTGALSVARGVTFLRGDGRLAAARCPACAQQK